MTAVDQTTGDIHCSYTSGTPEDSPGLGEVGGHQKNYPVWVGCLLSHSSLVETLGEVAAAYVGVEAVVVVAAAAAAAAAAAVVAAVVVVAAVRTAASFFLCLL